MLLWQPKERNKYLFLLELIIISTIAHLILGILLFVVYKGGISSFHVELGKSHSPTLFVPLKRPSMFNHADCQTEGRFVQRRKCAKSGSKHAESTNKTSSGAVGHKRMLGSDTTMKLEAEHNNPKARHFKKEITEESKYCDTKRGELDKKEIKIKTKSKKEKNKSISKKEHGKKIQEPTIQPAVLPQVEEQKPAAPMNEVKQPEQAPMPAEPQPSEPVEAPQIADNPEIPPQEAAHEQELADGVPMDEIIVGQSGYVGEYVTAEQARMHECIEQEIVSRWKPPRGLSKELSCQIKCCIGGDGVVVSCILEKHSGVLIYDMSARSAARAMSLPRWAWGKDFTIVFKQ